MVVYMDPLGNERLTVYGFYGARRPFGGLEGLRAMTV